MTKAGALDLCFKIIQAWKKVEDESRNRYNTFSNKEDEEEEVEVEEKIWRDRVIVGGSTKLGRGEGE